MRLVDFQIGITPTELMIEELKPINQAFFPLYEAIRLWLKEQKVEAPFRKIVVELVDATMAPKSLHGKVVNVLGIAHAYEPFELSEVIQRKGDFQWLGSIVLNALRHIESEIGWKCDEMELAITNSAKSNPPCFHIISKLNKTHRKSRVNCSVRLESAIGLSRVVVQFASPDRILSETVLLEKDEPIYLEDDFPLKHAAIVGEYYILTDCNRNELAKISIPG